MRYLRQERGNWLLMHPPRMQRKEAEYGRDPI